MRRTQIYIGDDQDRVLNERAESLGTSKSAVIRDAIDAFLQRGEPDAGAALGRMRAAVAEATGVAAYLPSGTDYVESLRALDADRERQLRARPGR